MAATPLISYATVVKIGVVVIRRIGGSSKRSIHKSMWAGDRQTDANLNVSELTAQAALAKEPLCT